MRRSNHVDEVREQRSVFYFNRDAGSDWPRPFAEIYTHMFVEDVSRRLFPAWTSRHDSNVTAEVSPTNVDLERMLSTALDISRQRYHRSELASSLSEFLRLTMVELCLARRAVFEIVYLRPKAGEPRSGFELLHINSRQLFQRWGRWYQNVPAEIAQERQVEEQIALPSETVAVFTLPERWGRSVASAMEVLSVLSDYRWHGLALAAQDSQLPYDFSIHERSMRIALAEAVRDIGWTARGSLNDKVTNYYSLRQDLQFQLFQLEVREALLAQLNAVLQRAGSVLGWSAQLSIKGLPDRSTIEQAMAQLAAGAKPFTEVMDSVRNT